MSSRTGRRAATIALGLACALAIATLAHADADAARAAYERGERARAARDYAAALAAYRAALASDPSAPFAAAAQARAEALASHAEGNFAPLARLDAVRSDPIALGDPATVAALERDAEGFPDGFVRSEARVVVAEAYWHQLGDPKRAAVLLERAVDDAAAERTTRALALTELVAIDRELGDLGSARRVVRAHADFAPRLAAEIERLVWRVRGRYAALVALALVGVAAAAAFVRRVRGTGVRAAARAVVRSMHVGFALYLGIGAAVLARAYGADPRPFLWLGAGVLGVDAIAVGWCFASPGARRPARIARGIACALAVVAVGFLALERSDPTYLDAFGL